jgi:ADP-ribose pyrophosphatase YjhB (NUDIX family)
MKDKRHFVTGDFQSHATWLSEEDYAKVLDNIVIACVDCILVNDKREMLLGKRNIEPAPTWWIVGGRMKPGESFKTAAARNVKRELNLSIDPVRFHYFDTYSFVWARRAQPPKDNGCHTVSITMKLNIDEAEIRQIKPNEEYEKIQWIKPEKILANSSFHPGIQKCAEDLIRYTR